MEMMGVMRALTGFCERHTTHIKLDAARMSLGKFGRSSSAMAIPGYSWRSGMVLVSLRIG